MSTATIATILLLGVFLVLVFLRVPVVYAIGVASLLDFFYLGINPMQMALKFVSNLNSYTLLAVPFFILMGELMSAGRYHRYPDRFFKGTCRLDAWRCCHGQRGGLLLLRRHLRLFFRRLCLSGPHRDQDDGRAGL